MIVEHARVAVLPGHGPEFERAVAEATERVFPQAQGFIGLTLHRCIEEPESYLCALRWDTLEAHTVTFREGPLFAQWRALVGPHFAASPVVWHYDLVATG